MQRIPCPICKRENIIEPGKISNCAVCDVDLVLCKYCIFLNNNESCGHAKGDQYYLPNGEGAKNCSYYESRYKREPTLWEKIPAHVWVAISIALAFILLTIVAYSIDPEMRHFRGNELQVNIEVIDNLTTGNKKALYINVINPLQIKSTDITLQISGDFISNVLIGQPVITNIPGVFPKKIQKYENKLTITLDPLAPDSNYIIIIPYNPNYIGEKNLHIQVFAPQVIKVQDIDRIINNE